MWKIIDTTDKRNLGMIVEDTQEIFLRSGMVFHADDTKYLSDTILIVSNPNYIIRLEKEV